MKSSHLLNLGNPRKVKGNLSSILDKAALDRIETEIEKNVLALLDLAKRHYNFARKQSNPNWRQKISRLYYAAYNASRAVRLYVSGHYSTDVRDHQKSEKLPDDFPNRAQYVNSSFFEPIAIFAITIMRQQPPIYYLAQRSRPN